MSPESSATPHASTPASGASLNISARGARRRLQALHARGWMAEDLAPAIGIPAVALERTHWQATISPRVHAIIAAAYEVLWNATPPCTPLAREHEMARAAANGWVPPMAWDDIDTDPEPQFGETDTEILDDVAVAEAVAGHRPHLTHAERLAAVRHLHAAGHWDPVIANTLGVSSKTVSRDRIELGLESNFEIQKREAA